MARCDVGLIPARAGSTWEALRAARGSWAHPRSRGEHGLPHPNVFMQRGSSPLARGALFDVLSDLGADGLIPARAGSTTSISPCSARTAAHPRSRGEHCARSSAARFSNGSSPLARGAPGAVASGCCGCGLIPARAGSTHGMPLSFLPVPAHPRSRGEHTKTRLRERSSRGSSPLARGAPLRWCLRRAAGGLIPARAGSTYP